MIKHETDKFFFNATSNLLKNTSARKQIKKQYAEAFKKDLPKKIERMGKISSFISTENPNYYFVIHEAEEGYIFGNYHSTIAMVGIIAERFSKELEAQMNFELNRKRISRKKLFERELTQHKRLKLLLHSGLIKSETFSKLDKIRKIRNDYVHYEEKISKLKAKRDALKILNHFLDILNSRFSERYKIVKGRIVKR